MTEKKKKYHKRWGTSNIGKVRRIFRFMRLGMYITIDRIESYVDVT